MRNVISGRYLKVGGQWTRYTLAFLCYCQWQRRNPHMEHGLTSGRGRTGNKPMPPRNYSVWPIFERVESRRGAEGVNLPGNATDAP